MSLGAFSLVLLLSLSDWFWCLFTKIKAPIHQLLSALPPPLSTPWGSTGWVSCAGLVTGTGGSQSDATAWSRDFKAHEHHDVNADRDNNMFELLDF